MSYDLDLIPRAGEKAPALEELRAFFDGRKRWRLGPERAVYDDGDTGVGFFVELRAPAEGEAAPSPALSVNVSLFRPHFFGLEAAMEVQAIVDAFGFDVDDPQIDGMGRGPFSIEGFARGYHGANAAAYSVHLRDDVARGDPYRTALPTAELERTWRWNVVRDEHQQKLGEGVSVPGIFFVRVGGHLSACALWSDALPIALPKVDLLALVLHDLAPRRFLWKKRGVALVPYDRLGSLLRFGSRRAEPREHILFERAPAPAELRAFFSAAELTPGKLDVVAMPDLLNKEIVDEAATRIQRSPEP